MEAKKIKENKSKINVVGLNSQALIYQEDNNQDFKCGNSMFTDIEWDFNDYSNPNNKKSRRFVINFEVFKNKPKILNVVKWFTISQLNENKLSTVKRNFDGLIRLGKFLNDEVPMIESFSEFDEELLLLYFEYLISAKSETNGKELSKTSITKAAFVIKEILTLGSVRGWDVPDDTTFVRRLYDQEILNNYQLKRKSDNAIEKVKNKVVDTELIEDVLSTAVNDLKDNKNIIVASAVIITSQLGLRLNELLSLEYGCIKRMNNSKMLVYETKKLESETRKVSHPANELVELAIKKMTEYSEKFRKEANSNKLFLIRHVYSKGSPVVEVSLDNFNKNYLTPWIRTHKFTYRDGRPIDFTSHTFRHIFATYAFSGGTSLSTISKLMNHKSIRGTEHYTHLLVEDIKKRFTEVMSKGSILAGNKAPKIRNRLEKDNPFKGKTVEQVDMLKKSMKIQELPHGLCLHHPMRNEPCEGDGICLGCDNFITTPRFLDVHKDRLNRVRDTLSQANENGPFEKKMKHIEASLVELIKDLEGQMATSKDWL